MNFLRRQGGLSILVVLAASRIAALGQQAAPPAAAAADVSAQKWSESVWQSAMNKDQQALERYFQAVPTNPGEQVAAGRFRDSLALFHTNTEMARVKRDEARAKALGELGEHVAANDLSKALRSAVTVQTLSDNMDSAFENADIVKIIQWAKDRIPQVETELDWLSAQELLYFLRTLYEDTSHFQEYKQYREDLDAVNRRVMLLAQYAPHRLHELRARRAERLGEKPLGDFKPNEASDWDARTRDITRDMLKDSLKTAAKEHIEAKRWRPLLQGGLQELRLMATTASLDETFPKLGDAELVRRWVAHLDEELSILDNSKDTDVDGGTLTRILDDLKRENEKTIQLGADPLTGIINPGVIYREFGDGALYQLDEFSEIIWPDKLPRFKQATEGAFVGVGILIRHNDTQEIVVVNPLEGTPAYFGGVKPNDTIAEVDGESTVGWSLNDAVDRITGAKATQVTLGLKREGIADIIPIKLTRDEIKLRSVMGWWKRDLHPDGSPEWDWYIDPVSRIAYIKLTQFTEDSYEDIKQAWSEITAKDHPAGLILDLRYNPGGLLTSAVQISNLFVKEGVIVSGEDKNGNKAWADQKADPTKAKLAEIPTVILINQGSASASEIVSGCLQAHSAAVIVGERSFGKGSVQTVHPIAGNARLKLTTQYYRLPAAQGQTQGRLVHKRIGATVWGVDPDIIVKMTPQQATDALELRQKNDVIPQDANGKLKADSKDRGDINRLLTEGMDPQLETALLILQARALGNEAIDTQHALKSD